MQMMVGMSKLAVDYGLDLDGMSFAVLPIRLPNGTGLGVRNAAGDADLTVVDVDGSDQLVLGRSLASGKFFVNVDGTVQPVTAGPADSGGTGYRILRIPN